MPRVSPNTLPLSVVIIALNEERRIADCIDSVRDLTGDIVIVDSGSTDRTVEIATAKGARVFNRAWDGYSAQKNFGNAQAGHDWILSLDADERVSAGLAASLRRIFAEGPRHDVYDVAFENYFGATRVRFGAWNPESHARVFDRRLLQWNTDAVHEGLCGPGKFRRGRLAGAIQHVTVDSHAQLAAKSEHYAALFAAKLRHHRRNPGWPKVWLNPGWRFVRDYVVRFGVLDGRVGLVIAWEAARYTHLKYRDAQIATRGRRFTDWLAMGATAAMLALLLARISPHAPTAHSLPPNGIAAHADSNSSDSSAPHTLAQTDIDDDNATLEMLPDDDDIVV